MRTISIEELAKQIAELTTGEQLSFAIGDEASPGSGDVVKCGAIKTKVFDGAIVVINHYGGGNPFIIDLESGSETDQQEYIVHGLRRYIPDAMADEIFVETIPMLDKQKLYSQDELIRILAGDGANEPALAAIGERYMDSIGEDPIWRFPLSDGFYEGGFIVPVREGWAWIPYDEIDKEEYEQLALDSVNLLDALTCEHLAKELWTYTDALCATLHQIRRELQNECPIPPNARQEGSYEEEI